MCSASTDGPRILRGALERLERNPDGAVLPDISGVDCVGAQDVRDAGDAEVALVRRCRNGPAGRGLPFGESDLVMGLGHKKVRAHGETAAIQPGPDTPDAIPGNRYGG